MSSVYIVLNEWLPAGRDEPSMEVMGAYSTFDKAHDSLSKYANLHDLYLELDADNFVIEGTKSGLYYDEYRIDEWELDQNE